MKILDLPLKKEWYNMIESGVKTEEYREKKKFWAKRICSESVEDLTSSKCSGCPFGKCSEYTHVNFRYGYTTRTMLFELKSIHIGVGNPEWGAPEEEVFILKLGEKINELS